jgi:hypothetical protein
VVDDAGDGSGEAVPDDGVGLGDAITPGDELVDAPVDPGVEETAVSSWSFEVVGSVVVDSAGAVGLVGRLVGDEP